MAAIPIEVPTAEACDRWLREMRPRVLSELWRQADAVRAANVGDEVHLRGLVEISSHCVRTCHYCGLSHDRSGIRRYRMDADEVLACAHEAKDAGYGTVVIQGGEDYGMTRAGIADIVHRIKAETGLAVTLSLGERPDEDLEAWKAAGADRYLMRFETSDPALYQRIHPDLGRRVSDRIAILRRLRELGYQVGSGVMVGIPGQTYAILVRDLQLFRELALDMIGVGPYLAHPDTPLGRDAAAIRAATPDQVPSDELTTYKTVALARLLCPWANIPATTALATVNTESGRELGWQRGANVVMPNMTPVKYRALYEIYPGKACINETAEQCNQCLMGRIHRTGRVPGQGPGHTRRHREEQT